MKVFAWAHGFAIVVDWVATFVDSTLKVEDIQRRMAQRIKVTLMPKEQGPAGRKTWCQPYLRLSQGRSTSASQTQAEGSSALEVR